MEPNKEAILKQIRGIVGGLIPYDIPDSVLLTTFRGEAKEGLELQSSIGHLWLWLSNQPNISQGGISVSWSEGQRVQFRLYAKHYFRKANDTEGLELIPTEEKVTYGYKGHSL